MKNTSKSHWSKEEKRLITKWYNKNITHNEALKLHGLIVKKQKTYAFRDGMSIAMVMLLKWMIETTNLKDVVIK